VLAQYQSGTQTRRTPELVAITPEPLAEIHPVAAALAGVGDGDALRLTTRRGAATFTARVTRGIREDSIFVPFHWGGEQSVNQLTNAALDPVSRMPEFKVCAVRAERALPPNHLKQARPSFGQHTMTPLPRLVVIGNGMAGARFVEEMAARDAHRRFEITVFGDEPHGNYNRIMLSGVLAGTHRMDDIVINPLSWYLANGIKLHAGSAWIGSTSAKSSSSARTGSRSRTTRSSSPPAAVRGFRQSMVLVSDTGTLKNGAFVFRTIDDCDQMVARAQHARAAVVIGGGLLGIEAARGLRNHGLNVTIVHLMPHVMDAQLDAAAGRILRRQLETMGLTVLTARRRRRCSAANRSPACASRMAPPSTARWSSSQPAFDRTPNWPVAQDSR
jgi:hypothetical protein